MAIMKTLAKNTPIYRAIDNQELARLSACMSAMLDEIDALDVQLLGSSITATAGTTATGIAVILSSRQPFAPG
jgi:hypothetical protein